MTYTRPALGDPGNSGPTSAVTIIDALSDGLEAVEAGAIYGYFSVRAYGAVGDGSTNDTSAINSAIAALNSAGRGVLYFPPGDYSTTGGLTTITAAATVRGEGTGDAYATNAVTTVKSSSATANLFTSTRRGVKFENMSLICTAVTATAGAAIYVTNISNQVGGGDANRYIDLAVSDFYDGIHVDDGAEWYMDRCFIYNPYRYGLWIKHTDLPDGGDQAISNCQFVCRWKVGRRPTAAIYLSSGGGLKVTNCKVNGDMANTNYFTDGISISIGSGINTVDALVSNCSIEAFSGSGFKLVQSSGGSFGQVVVHGNQIAGYISGCNGISITGTATTSLGGIALTGNVLVSGATGTGTAITVTNANWVTVAGNTYGWQNGQTWGTKRTITGCTNTDIQDA